MAEAEAVTESVLEEYCCLEARGSISQQHRDRLRQRKAALSSGIASGGSGGAGVSQQQVMGSRGSSSSTSRGLAAGADSLQQAFFDPQLTARPVQLFPAF